MGKFWIISDTHFGVKNNSKKWEELMQHWMDKFFFPLLEEHANPDDVFVHCGDIFDNRQSIGLSTMSMCISFFEKLTKYFSDIYILCGNHDAYYTTKNDIASIDCLKHISKIHVIKKPTQKEIFGKNVMFVPWMEDENTFKKVCSIKANIDIWFCHAEFSGCTMNSSGTKSESNLNIPNMSHIYTGHIHHRHKYKNVTYVGSPYQLTQNDRNNSKCVWTYDPIMQNEQTYLNTFSPEFIRIKYQDVCDMSFREFKQLCKNKFVEIETDGALMAKCRFQKLLSLVNENDNILDLSFCPVNKESTVSENINISDCTTISEMLEKYVNEMIVCDPQIKKSVLAISKKLIYG